MSFSKEIIFGSDADMVVSLQSGGVKIDVIDEYGYTPLIQTAIVDSVNKARLLLEAGAKVDFTDLTNRTALHWAASNSNYALCELLLKNGANPNAYTYAGQSVLVMPLLKKQEKIKKLLLTYGANLNFAQDFINAKLLGHRFNLEGRVDIIDDQGTFIEVELEGFYLEFSLEVVLSSLTDFRNNFAGKHLRKFFPKIDIIIRALKVAIELIKYQNYLVDIKKYEKRINALLGQEPLLLPISFGGHAITLIKSWEWFIRCDRGAFGRDHGTIIYYYMHNPTAFTKAFVKQLLYKRQHDSFINVGLIKHLGLEDKMHLPLSPQITGNCAWANVEAVVPTMLFWLLSEDGGGKNHNRYQEDALLFYKEWMDWDKERELYFCFQSFEEANPARKASKAALLAAILFQSCDYDNKEDQYKARKILPILTLPNYDYILKSYLKAFEYDQQDRYIKNLRNFLDDYGWHPN